MDTRLVNVVIHAADTHAQAEFWSALLGWRIFEEEPGVFDVLAPEDDAFDAEVVFVPVSDPKTGKNRIHFDLASRTMEHHGELVERALRLGARHLDIGQGDVPWTVLADPEGNEFCFLEPRERYQSGAVASILVDARDPLALAEFWSLATGWPIEAREEDDELVGLRSPRGLWLEFGRSTDENPLQNRVHLDVAPTAGGDQAKVVAALIDAGAARADIGQGDVPWVVMTDPEGNEFCVLTPRGPVVSSGLPEPAER